MIPEQSTHSKPERRLASGLILSALLLILMAWNSSAAADTIDTVAFNGKPVNLLPLLEFTLEKPDETFEDIIFRPASDWSHRTSISNNLGHESGALWARVRISGLSSADTQTIIRLNYPHLDYVDFYLLEKGQLIKHMSAGDQVPFSEWPVDKRTFWFPVQTGDVSAEEQELYLRISSPGLLKMPLEILSFSDAADAEIQMHLWAGAIFGIMFIMMMYNAFLYSSLHDGTYLIYVVYLFTISALQFTLFGFGQQYLWGETPGMNNTMLAFLIFFTQAMSVMFVVNFVNLKKFGSMLDMVYAYGFLAVLLVLSIASFSAPYEVMIRVGVGISTLTLLSGFYIGLKGWMMGMKPARLFTSAWFLHLFFIGWFLLDIAGQLSSTGRSDMLLSIGFIIEVALLSLAFADKMNQERELRITSQTRLLDMQLAMNKELDSKVQERTVALQRANQRLEELSITDGLTGLYNRRHFDKQYLEKYSKACKEQLPIAVMMIDIDHFKNLNDTHGHAFGDLCLVHAAGIIQKVVTMSDAVSARYGGEEFVVVLPKTTEARAVQLGEIIRQEFARTRVKHQNHAVTMTVSIGVADEIPEHLDQAEKLLKYADNCLYFSKENGRNQVSYRGNINEAS